MGVDVGELDEEAAAKYEELMKRLKLLMRRYKDVEGRPEARTLETTLDNIRTAIRNRAFAQAWREGVSSAGIADPFFF